MMRISLILLSLSLLFISIDAAFPTVDFTGLLQKYATTTDGTWCTKCAAFGQPPCAMGCAGDGGGGGPCPANACPRLFTFPIVNNQPIWNIQVATVGDPYRAFSYIPLCTQASQCTESFFFSFSFKYTPGPNAAQSNFFSQQRDYLKLLFWGDGNNILGVKNGQLLGLPNGGGGDLVGSNNIGTGNAFAIPFLKDTWTHVGVQFNVNNGRTSLSFFINGVATGSTTGSVAIQNSGLQFGAYVWNGAFFTLQYKDIVITKNLPNVATPVTTAKPTTTTAPTIAPPAPVNPTQGFPSVDFTALLQKYATTTDGTWCSKCAAFGQPPCAMGCAGDGGGGGPCPVNACPRLFSFPIVNNQPIWNINVQTVGDPYRAFSYIPICTQAGQCIESFFFSFSFKYTPDATSAQTNFFSQTRDYLKLLFWGDGNNILGVKNGQLLGLPNGGGVDLVGSNNIGTGNAFAIPFLKDTWTHVGVQLNVNNGRTSLAFFINGVATGSTSGSVGVSNTGLQFGAYVWNGAKFTLQYKDIAITKNLPIISTGGGTTTTATPVTAMPTTATVTEQPPLDGTTNPPLDDTTDPPSSTDPPSVTTREPTPPPAGSGGPSMPIYNPATVALHNKATDCWTILDGVVYDISKLVLIHPGGAVIRSYCGIDCSTIFSSSHQNDSADRALLAKSYLKGTLGSMTTSTPTNPAIISIVSRSNHATTITFSLFCMMASLVVALVLEYLL